MFEGFTLAMIDTGEVVIRVRYGGVAHRFSCFTVTRKRI